jgi:hypothetical protein
VGHWIKKGVRWVRLRLTIVDLEHIWEGCSGKEREIAAGQVASDEGSVRRSLGGLKPSLARGLSMPTLRKNRIQ